MEHEYARADKPSAGHPGNLALQIRELKNKREFLEVLATVWPLKSVLARIDELQNELSRLEQQRGGKP
jgi:hypothetical protein